MLLRVLDNGEIEFPITLEELQNRFPHTSFALPLTQSALPEGYEAIHYEDVTQGLSPGPNQKIDLLPPILEDGRWIQKRTLCPLSEEELNNLKYKKVQERNRLLAASDWTQLPDVPSGTSEKYLNYRQKLRDITQDPQFPFVTFPEV